jgi:adenylate cyclase
MKVEIERKFLVRPSKVQAVLKGAGRRLTQGYLSSKPSVRVRLDHGGKAWLTIKSEAVDDRTESGEKNAPSRQEYEYEIPVSDAKGLLALSLYQLDKVRYRVKVGAHEWEIDEFLGPHAGLWMAEIELSRPDERFEKPDWLSDEVSDDPRYSNGALAKAGRAPAASRAAVERALTLLGDRLAQFDSGKRLSTIGPLMEAASLMAVADGEVDDDEREVIHRVLQKLSIDGLSSVVADAMLSSSVEQTRELGVDKRCSELASALVKHDVVREGIFIAVLVAEISGGMDAKERAVLDRLVTLTKVDETTVHWARNSVLEALGR